MTMPPHMTSHSIGRRNLLLFMLKDFHAAFWREKNLIVLHNFMAFHFHLKKVKNGAWNTTRVACVAGLSALL